MIKRLKLSFQSGLFGNYRLQQTNNLISTLGSLTNPAAALQTSMLQQQQLLQSLQQAAEQSETKNEQSTVEESESS